MKKLYIFFLLIMSFKFVVAQTWTGTTSTNWSLASNWSPAVAPTGTSNVIIPASVASGNWPAFSGNVTINSINMAAGSQLNVNGFTLTINGINTYNYFIGATLNNTNGATDIVLNMYTGNLGYTSYFRSNVVNDHIVFNLTGASNSPFYEGDAGAANQFNGNATYNINDALPIFISNGIPAQYNGNVTINRTTVGVTNVFTAGGATVSGNFSLTNNSGGAIGIGNYSITSNIAGTVNINAVYPSPATYTMYNIKNQTTGGTINIQNSQGMDIQKDTLKVALLSVTGFRGSSYAYLFNNAITGNVIIADDASYTGGYATHLRSNVITGNSTFTNNGTNFLYESDIALNGNTYNGNVSFIATGSGSLSISSGAAIVCNGNLTVTRTAAGNTNVFNSGGTVSGNLTYTNNTAGDTYFGNTAAKTSIGGTVNMTANYTANNIFQVYRLINQTTGGSINVQGSRGFDIRNDTLKVTAFNITAYTGSAYGYFFNNSITGNVNLSSDVTYTGGYATYLRSNLITGATTFTNNSTNVFYDADLAGSANHYIGNTIFNSASSGNFLVSHGDASQFDGNLNFNRTVAGTTYIFNAGGIVNGNFNYTNNTAGNSYFGNVSVKTSISGTVNVTANYSTPNNFEMYRIINQTGGGIINIQNSAGFNIQKDTLIINSLSIIGYGGNQYGYFYNNSITGNLTTSDIASYGGGYTTNFRNNIIAGNTSITINGTNILYDTDGAGTGNKYIGNLAYTRTAGSINIGANDFVEVTQNLTLNAATGITLGKIKFNGSTNGIIDQLSTQPINIATLAMEKTGGGKLTLNDSVTVTTTVDLTGGNIFTSAGNNLIFPDNISYTGSSASSHVVGPVTKIGDDAFIFPLGSPTSLNTIAMSAPVGVASNFRAEYKNQNPTSDGYNTNSKAGSFGAAGISKAGYWNVQRIIGTTNVTLTEGFATNPYEQYPVLTNLKVAHWNGAQWDDHGNGGTTGTSASGTVINSVPITSFSPFALAGITNTYFYKYSNPGTGPDGTPVKFGGIGGYPAYSTKQLPAGSYSLDSIYLIPNASSASFKLKDFYGVEKDDTTVTAPTAPVSYITANGNGTKNFTGWRHFVYMTNGSNQIMGAVKDNNLTLGNTVMNTYFATPNVATAPNGNIYLKRSFKITSQFAPVGTRRVRFYISKTEFTNLQAADPTSFPSGINSLTITKYTGPQEDSLFNPIPGGNSVIIPNSSITIADLGTMYSLDIDITGFSGFYIGGNSSKLNVCTGSTISIPSNISGSTYQWQADNGGGFTNISNTGAYSGTSTSSLTITNAPTSLYGYKYRCQVNGGPFSQEYTLKFNTSWEGTVSNVWENAANWSCGVLPDLATDVVINAGKPNFPQLGVNTTVRTLKINTGANVTVKTGFNLAILK